jgi:outer membrane protein assembly factor BamB
VAERRTTRCCSAPALVIVALLATSPTRMASATTAPMPFWPLRTVWTLALNNQLVQPPAFDDSNGYFAIEGDRLVAYEMKNGARRWNVDAKLASAPVAGGGFVFFLADGAMTALHASDGSPAWTAPVAQRLAAAPVWNAGWLILATVDGGVAAIRASDGHPIWSRNLGSPAHAPPAISGDRVYVPASNTHIVALKIETGERVWERRLGGAPNEILALEDRLFVGSNDNYFYAIVAKDGRVDWRWRAGADAMGLPVVDEHRVYFVSLDNVVRALNQSNGVQQWIQLLNFRPSGGPLIAGSTLIVYGAQPPLRALSTADGKAAGDVPAAGPLAAPPGLLMQDETPVLVIATRDIAKGDTVTLMARSAEPTAVPFAPLANPIATVPPLPVGSAGLQACLASAAVKGCATASIADTVRDRR